MMPMKKLLFLLPLSLSLACSANEDGTVLRTVLLIAAGVLSVVLLILFGRPNAKRKNKND